MTKILFITPSPSLEKYGRDPAVETDFTQELKPDQPPDNMSHGADENQRVHSS